MENNIRLRAIGNIKSLPRGVQEQLRHSIDLTGKNNGLQLILALSYGSRWEILNAIKEVILDIKSGKLSSDNLDDKVFENYLDTAGFPDPELVIRTSGEYRVSNFLLWQIAYAELYFTPTLWPDFRREHLYEAIINFQSRERRFGKTTEQIKRNIHVNN